MTLTFLACVTSHNKWKVMLISVHAYGNYLVGMILFDIHPLRELAGHQHISPSMPMVKSFRAVHKPRNESIPKNVIWAINLHLQKNMFVQHDAPGRVNKGHTCTKEWLKPKNKMKFLQTAYIIENSNLNLYCVVFHVKM